jgi:hypothetical protein
MIQGCQQSYQVPLCMFLEDRLTRHGNEGQAKEKEGWAAGEMLAQSDERGPSMPAGSGPGLVMGWDWC